MTRTPTTARQIARTYSRAQPAKCKRCKGTGAIQVADGASGIIPCPKCRTARFNARPAQPTATDALMSKCVEIDALIARLQAVRDDHFDASPDTADWGHVGSAAHVADLLRQAADFADPKGAAPTEYTTWNREGTARIRVTIPAKD